MNFKDKLMYFFTSVVCGVFTGGLIFCFKTFSNYVILFSYDMYSFVRENTKFLPLFIMTAAIIAVIVSFILKSEPTAKGGGIPTAISAIKGFISFNWIKNIIAVFLSANLTFLCGLPLGNEGPSVQMGTAVGKGTIKVFGKNLKYTEQNIMIGGASAGFAAATGAPISSMVFAFEEIHKKYSLKTLLSVLLSVFSSTLTVRILSKFWGTSPYLFHFSKIQSLPLKFLWISLLVGLVCGISAVLFTKAHYFISKFTESKSDKIPFMLKIVFIFVLAVVLGFFVPQTLGSGHAVIDTLISEKGVIYLSVIYLIIRVGLLLFANNLGITGGLFLPTLCIGGLVGSVFGNLLINCSGLNEKFLPAIIVISIAAYMGAVSKTPVLAFAFGLEALCGISNALGILIAVAFGFLVMKIFKTESFVEKIVKNKEKEHKDNREEKPDLEYETV